MWIRISFIQYVSAQSHELFFPFAGGGGGGGGGVKNGPVQTAHREEEIPRFGIWI